MPWDKMPALGTKDHCLHCNEEIEVIQGLERDHWWHVKHDSHYCPPRTVAEPARTDVRP